MTTRPDVTRRTVLKATAAAGAATVAGVGLPGSAAAATDLESWFGNTSNFDGVADHTGESAVTIEVGVDANGGGYGFGPAAVRVDPGTEVTWKWVGGTHNVVAEDGSFESELVGEAGHTFTYTPESAGVTKYACTPHKPMGMKGALVVGDAEVGASASGGDAGGEQSVDFDGWFENTGNFDGVTDATGQSEVSVDVGTEANGGAFGFGPAAIQVDPGTTVTWTWTGNGGVHNVAAKDGSFESELVGESGHTFSHTFEEAGVHEYFCVPHKPMGMKGAVVVGDGGSSGSGGSSADGGDGFSTSDLGVVAFGGALVAGLVSPFVAKAFGRSK